VLAPLEHVGVLVLARVAAHGDELRTTRDNDGVVFRGLGLALKIPTAEQSESPNGPIGPRC
jgi:hypothetical protein